MKKLYGVITAMTTPFTLDGKPDVEAIERHTQFLIDKGVDCLYPCGTTGEMYLMSEDERKLVAETVVKKVAGRLPVFVHCGAMCPNEVVRLCLHAHDIGADGVGIVTPNYFTVDNRAMVMYYKDICQQLPKGFPVYIYVIPQLAHNDVDAPTMQKIADACPDNVIGVKYSFCDMRRFVDYTQINGGKFSVVFGPDDLFLPALVMGADGTVSGCSSCIPEPFVDVYRAYKAGDMKAARESQIKCFNMVKILKGGADMSIFKNILSARGIEGGHMKLPLRDLPLDEVPALIESVKPYYDN